MTRKQKRLLDKIVNLADELCKKVDDDFEIWLEGHPWVLDMSKPVKLVDVSVKEKESELERKTIYFELLSSVNEYEQSKR